MGSGTPKIEAPVQFLVHPGALDFAVNYDMIYSIELGTPLACSEETGGLIGEKARVSIQAEPRRE
jgi:hypothetical protein